MMAPESASSAVSKSKPLIPDHRSRHVLSVTICASIFKCTAHRRCSRVLLHFGIDESAPVIVSPCSMEYMRDQGNDPLKHCALSLSYLSKLQSAYQGCLSSSFNVQPVHVQNDFGLKQILQSSTYSNGHGYSQLPWTGAKACG